MSALPKSSPQFLTTHWSLVTSARDVQSPASAAALEALCRAYWHPLYAFARRKGQSCHDAQDLTQEFFARLVEKNYLNSASAEKGRFRTFLLVAFQRFLAKEWQRGQAIKRGGGTIHIPLDTESAESRYLAEPMETLTAERIFEQRWAVTLLEQTLKQLRSQYEDRAKKDEFELLKGFLTAERGSIPYETISASLHISVGAARVQLHRLRKLFRELFRGQIEQTISHPEELDDEIHHVVAILSEN